MGGVRTCGLLTVGVVVALLLRIRVRRGPVVTVTVGSVSAWWCESQNRRTRNLPIRSAR